MNSDKIMTKANWFVLEGQDVRGPFTSREIRKMARTKLISPGHKLWKDGLESWVYASRIKGLFPLVSESGTSGQERLIATEKTSTIVFRCLKCDELLEVHKVDSDDSGTCPKCDSGHNGISKEVVLQVAESKSSGKNNDGPVSHQEHEWEFRDHEEKVLENQESEKFHAINEAIPYVHRVKLDKGENAYYFDWNEKKGGLLSKRVASNFVMVTDKALYYEMYVREGEEFEVVSSYISLENIQRIHNFGQAEELGKKYKGRLVQIVHRWSKSELLFSNQIKASRFVDFFNKIAEWKGLQTWPE